MVSDGTVLRVWNWCVNTTMPIEKSIFYTSTITFSVINRTSNGFGNDHARQNDREDEIVFASLCCRKFGIVICLTE